MMPSSRGVVGRRKRGGGGRCSKRLIDVEVQVSGVEAKNQKTRLEARRVDHTVRKRERGPSPASVWQVASKEKTTLMIRLNLGTHSTLFDFYFEIYFHRVLNNYIMLSCACAYSTTSQSDQLMSLSLLHTQTPSS